MKIRKGDKVQIVSGKDRGKTGTVLHAFPLEERIVVEGVNIKKLHEKARRRGQKSGIVEKPAPIDASNAMIVDPKSGKPTRIGIVRKDGTATRVAKKSGQEM